MYGNDFLKACTTNVKVVEGLMDWYYTHYTYPEQEFGQDTLGRAIGELRRRNIVCSAQPNRLWVFGQTDEDILHAAELQDLPLTVQEKGLVRDTQPLDTSNGVEVKDILLEAVEGSTTYLFAMGHGMVHAGPCEWLLSPAVEEASESNGTATIIKLHTRMTESGAMYVSWTKYPSNLRPLHFFGALPGSEVFLAPSGVKARLIAQSDTKDPLPTTADRQIIRGAHWKQSVSDVLLAECIEISPEDKWSVVELSGANNTEHFIWPERLCLAHWPTTRPDLSSASDIEWQYWFNNPSYTQAGFRDPFAAAEGWFKDVTTRDMTTPAKDTAMIDNTASSSAAIAETPIATSPPFNQRQVDQQAALAGIYPTPPDGLVPGHLPVHPTSDSLSSAMQIDSTAMEEDSALPADADHAGRGNSMESAREGPTYKPHSDDLFGDITEMDFGTNEVGDEDFDYFDEPDEETEGGEGTKDTDMVEEHAAGADDNIHQPPTDMVMNSTDATPRSPNLLPSESLPDPPTVNTVPDSPVMVHEEPPAKDSPLPPFQSPAPVLHPPEKPLSPFGIKERLFPPPVPASAMSADGLSSRSHHRSTFDPVQFNEGLTFSDRYTVPNKLRAQKSSPDGPNISLPSKSKKERSKPSTSPDDADTDMYSSSEDDSYGSMTSVSEDDNMPPKLPWESKKRKRTSMQGQLQLTGPQAQGWFDDASGMDDENIVDDRQMQMLTTSIMRRPHRDATGTSTSRFVRHNSVNGKWNSASVDVAKVLALTKPELIYVAQLVCEQASSSTGAIKAAVKTMGPAADPYHKSTEASVATAVRTALDHILPSAQDCGPAKLALIKEPPPRPIAANSKAPQMSQPRMPYREGSMQLGPDFFPIPPPYVRVQRGADAWEMLPPAVDFWNALSLGPANGAKDMTSIIVLPDNADLASSAQDFMRSFSRAYESCKLGICEPEDALSLPDPGDEEDGSAYLSYENGVLKFRDTADAPPIESAMNSYRTACEQIGKAIEPAGREHPNQSVVILLVDPFETDWSTQFLCACYWRLFRYCRASTSKASQKAPRSDIVLQIIPISLLASPDGLVVLDSAQYVSLAMEVYNRCPPSSKTAASTDIGAALSIMAAPAVELSSVSPKRIAFQLTADPPSDLMHEGSVLHLAYSLSPDKLWLAVCWLDSTGRYQMTTTFCLRGRSFKDAAAEVWDRTCEIIAAREVTWRVFIVADTHIAPSIQKCWRALAISKVKKQVMHVTLIAVDDSPPIHLTPPLPAGSSEQTGQTAGQGFLTPGSTPQPGSLTVSPDASGQGHVPPTPTPAEPTAASENDPDAHLTDTADESWGMLLSPAFTSSSATPGSTAANTVPTMPNPLAKGLLFRRGNAAPTRTATPLKAMAISLHWDIRVRPGGAVDEGPARQAEMTLREVLRMYRGLALLGRMRRLGTEHGSLLPLHVACAVRGADGVNGFL
ncbi:mediator of RNA polymerase II transcription subunit 13 [Saxophila tyrrhenica]|uniref:Mediator of RNA polymerase II transcription subunit 13 n=1 Tax=Saxophila tyrrhenica TaxID=1690608 RepID=A0AAV9NZC3_9PEZI|nr:mediator of RNA polymerase II transcription subunit 13 [Saxophila tyrrhenica]